MAEKWNMKYLTTTLIEDIRKFFTSPLRTAIFVVLALIGLLVLIYFNANPMLGEANGIEPTEKIDFDYSKTSPERLVTGPEYVPEITVLMFTDYECQFCGKASLEFKKVLKNNPGIRLVYKDYPLDMSCNQRLDRPFHRYACIASLYARCAAEQGKFWEYHDLLIENQRQFDNQSLENYAIQLNLNLNQFKKCAESGKYMDAIITDIDEGVALGISGTPTFFIEGRKVEGYRTADQYQEIIDNIRAEIKKEQEEYERQKAEFLKRQAEEALKKEKENTQTKLKPVQNDSNQEPVAD